MEASDLIVRGTVVEIEEVSSDRNTLPFAYDLTVAVEEYLKGTGPDTITVRDTAGLQGAACSAFDPDAVGRPYLLLLFRNKGGHLGTSSCAGSRAITDRNRTQMDETIQQIRQIVSGTALPTETHVPAQPDAFSTSTPLVLPFGGSGDSPEGPNTLLFAIATIAGLLGLGAVAAAGWRGARRG